MYRDKVSRLLINKVCKRHTVSAEELTLKILDRVASEESFLSTLGEGLYSKLANKSSLSALKSKMSGPIKKWIQKILYQNGILSRKEAYSDSMSKFLEEKAFYTLFNSIKYGLKKYTMAKINNSLGLTDVKFFQKAGSKDNLLFTVTVEGKGPTNDQMYMSLFWKHVPDYLPKLKEKIKRLTEDSGKSEAEYLKEYYDKKILAKKETTKLGDSDMLVGVGGMNSEEQNDLALQVMYDMLAFYQDNPHYLAKNIISVQEKSNDTPGNVEPGEDMDMPIDEDEAEEEITKDMLKDENLSDVERKELENKLKEQKKKNNTSTSAFGMFIFSPTIEASESKKLQQTGDSGMANKKTRGYNIGKEEPDERMLEYLEKAKDEGEPIRFEYHPTDVTYGAGDNVAGKTSISIFNFSLPNSPNPSDVYSVEVPKGVIPRDKDDNEFNVIKKITGGSIDRESGKRQNKGYILQFANEQTERENKRLETMRRTGIKPDTMPKVLNRLSNNYLYNYVKPNRKTDFNDFLQKLDGKVLIGGKGSTPVQIDDEQDLFKFVEKNKSKIYKRTKSQEKGTEIIKDIFDQLDEEESAFQHFLDTVGDKTMAKAMVKIDPEVSDKVEKIIDAIAKVSYPPLIFDPKKVTTFTAKNVLNSRSFAKAVMTGMLFDALEKASTIRKSKGEEYIESPWEYLQDAILSSSMNILLNTNRLEKIWGPSMEQVFKDLYPVALYVERSKGVEQKEKNAVAEQILEDIKTNGYPNEYKQKVIDFLEGYKGAKAALQNMRVNLVSGIAKSYKEDPYIKEFVDNAGSNTFVKKYKDILDRAYEQLDREAEELTRALKDRDKTKAFKILINRNVKTTNLDELFGYKKETKFNEKAKELVDSFVAESKVYVINKLESIIKGNLQRGSGKKDRQKKIGPSDSEARIASIYYHILNN